MTEFTNQQLIDQAREEVDFWRERDELIPSQQTVIRLRLAEIAMVALMTPEQEPVADVVAWSSPSEERTCDIRWRRHDVKPGPLYTTPPAPVVPENPPEHLLPQGNSRDATYRRGATINGWNACRAAMLQGTAPRQHDELPGIQIKQVADLYSIAVPGGRSVTYSTDAAEASDCRAMGWDVQEFVKLERYQDAIVGNAPLIPDGYALVPVDMAPRDDARCTA